MAEYINREDAERALLERCKETGYGGLTPDDIRLVMRTPWRIPTADVVEVVRCKDCKEYGLWDDRMICFRFGSWYGNMKPDDYCSLGSKRGEDDV